jgi:hypothetical protein
VAIGYNSGSYFLGESSIAIGNGSQANGSGNYSIGVGYRAGANLLTGGVLNGQNANSIILNATGNDLNTTTTNQFIVKPIRNNQDITNLYNLSYDTISGEISYANIY